MHVLDIVEDVAIVFGNNKLQFRLLFGETDEEFVVNSVSDSMCSVVAQAGFTEVLNWALVSRKESFAHMLIDGTAVRRYG